MTDGYAPTTDEVREAAYEHGSTGVTYAEFDRWLAAHDADIVNQITRVEIIDDVGRLMVLDPRMGRNPELDLQDEGRTLKVFIKRGRV